jgi:hypothetical protein
MAITPERHRVPRPRLRVPRPQRWQRHRAWQQEDDAGDNADRNPVCETQDRSTACIRVGGGLRVRTKNVRKPWRPFKDGGGRSKMKNEKLTVSK